ncbi:MULTISPECIES: DNA alkylation repair protein [Corallococcus]|uniref:DNA alkylation repair protein n=1 Tax=Corallococcus TaxID=83461 RepID=UPI00137873A9|nr:MULTISPECIES: DNA alkylation repair protein [Corallococcus]NBD12447.1 DNA alkylation repair protein [Corallococcus silvisoli]
MTLKETMAELERLGSPQTRKTFLRHGAPEPLSGVNFGPLTALKKRIGTDSVLARALWATGHAEARLLATMVVDAPALSWAELDTWAKQLDWYALTDVFVTNVVLSSPHAVKALEWTRSPAEWLGRAGWQTLSSLLAKTQLLEAEDLRPWVKRIEQELPTAKNRVRDAMNRALINLGGTGGALQGAALATAKRLGRVDVDHGDTACETPDATQAIHKLQARKEAQAARKPARAQNPARKEASAARTPARKQGQAAQKPARKEARVAKKPARKAPVSVATKRTTGATEKPSRKAPVATKRKTSTEGKPSRKATTAKRPAAPRRARARA